MMKKIMIATMASLFLMGCGGGSGGSSSGGSSPSAAPQPEPIKTQDLVAPEGFSFNPVTEQSLTINLTGSLAERSHLSIYSEYTENQDGTYLVNYDSKIIDTGIDSGSGTIGFSLAESQSTIVAEIWSYDGSSPLQREFRVDDHALVWE